MVKNIFASSHLLTYLQDFDTSDSLSVGLVLGQTCDGKDYIVHMAKSPSLPPKKLRNLSDVNDLWLADHAKQATKMLSGGMYVIGIFVASETDLVTSFPTNLKAVLLQLSKSLSTEYLHGNTSSNEKIVINYCSKSKLVKCKLYDPIKSIVKPAEINFCDDNKWIRLECKYEIEKNYFWEEESPEMDLKEQMNVVLKDVRKNLKLSVILFDGEFKPEDECLELLGKQKKISKSERSSYENSNQDSRPIIVQILEETTDESSDIIIKDIKSQIKVVGQITSTVWMNPRASYKMASNAIVEDILRSLSTRLEMHWDSLIEEEHREDSNSIHEPPRRVMITIPGTEITVSDYLFPGEGAEEAKTSVEEILDIKLAGLPDEIQEVEGFIDITSYEGNISQIAEGKISKNDKEYSHKLFIIGLIFALLVLVVSIIVHSVLKNS